MKPATGLGTLPMHAWANAMGDLPGAIRLQTETWLKEQTELAGAMEELMAERVARCQYGAESAIRTFERMCGSRDGADALVAYNEWLIGSMSLIMADAAAMQEQATRMTQMGQRTLSALAEGPDPLSPAPDGAD